MGADLKETPPKNHKSSRDRVKKWREKLKSNPESFKERQLKNKLQQAKYRKNLKADPEKIEKRAMFKYKAYERLKRWRIKRRAAERPELQMDSANNSFSSPATECSSYSSHVSNHFSIYDVKNSGELIPIPLTKKRKRKPSHTLTSTQNPQQPALMNESHCLGQPHFPAKDMWKTVFSEYVLCELDRYEYHDAQRLKNQLNMVCLNFQPTQKVIENSEEVDETEFMICKVEENIADDNDDFGVAEKMSAIDAEHFVDINMLQT